MNTLLLALRNLLRNRRRSVVTLLAMVLGLVAILLFGGYIRDINYALQSDFVRLTGHLQVQRQGYFKLGSGNPASYGIEGYERILQVLRSDPELSPLLAVATPTLQFGGIAGNFAAGVSRTVYVNGSIVDDQSKLRDWNAYGLRRISKPLSLSGTPPDTAVIGTGVARVLQLCAALQVADCAPEPAASAASTVSPGASALSDLPPDILALSQAGTTATAGQAAATQPRLEILATNSRGAPNVSAVKVLRAEFQGIKELDDVHVGLHLSQAQRLIFGASTPKVTAISVQLKQTAQLKQARLRIEELIRTQFRDEPLEVLDYETLSPFYGQTLGMFVAIFGFVSVLIGAIVLFTVGNTMSMAVVERTSEIGTLRAIGVRQSGIRNMFMIEGVVLGLLGAALGTLTALALAWLVNQLGLTWTPPGRVEPVPLAVSVAGEYAMMLGACVGLVIVAMLSAILPATRAARMVVVDALRHV